METSKLAPATLPGDDPLAATPFRAIRAIGQGGMGTVYEAVHRDTGERAAVKVLQAELAKDLSVRDRVRLEFETLERLRTPEVVSVLAHGATSDGSVYVAMELLEGRNAKELLRSRGARPIGESVGLSIQLLRALDRAHAMGVLHRDLKPDNLFVLPDGRLKVLDFGIAKVFRMTQAAPDPLVMPTEEGVLVGTPRWCSPEAILGRPTDARSDIYSAGGCLYAFLNGSGPFELARGMSEIIDAQLNQVPLPLAPTLSCELLGPILDEVLARALAKSPDDRYPSASEMLADLNEIAFWARTLPALVPDAAHKLARAADPAQRPNVRLHLLRGKIPGFERLVAPPDATALPPLERSGVEASTAVEDAPAPGAPRSTDVLLDLSDVRVDPFARAPAGAVASALQSPSAGVATVPATRSRFVRDVCVPFVCGGLVALVLGIAAQVAYFGGL